MASIPAARRLGAMAFAVAILARCAAACAEGSAPAPAWTFAELPDEPVQFHGVVDMDRAGHGPHQMLYPTGGLGVLGLLVGVATHAALEAGTRSSEETRLQAQADKVLEPYREAIAGLRLRALQRAVLDEAATPTGVRLRPLAEVPAGELVVQAAPSFSMTPDAAALVLDEVVVLSHAASTDTPVTQAVRIVTPPRIEADPQAAWSAEGGAALKATAVALVAQSLALVMAHSRQAATDAAPMRTVRYAQGGIEKMERGQLLDETCAYMTLRTLRGGLLVVPHRAQAVLPAGCPAPAAARAPLAADGFDPAGGVPAAAGAASAAGG